MSIFRLFLIGALITIGSSARAAGVPDDCTQLIVGIASDWNSMRGTLQLFERPRGGSWNAASARFPVLFGKSGLAWGIGLAGQDEAGLKKKERDGRAPAGVFRIGEIYTYDAQLPPGGDYPFHQVSEGDIWSDDPRSPNYNRHITIDPKNPPDNYSHEKMRSGDFAYHWLIDIRHNSDPPIPRRWQRDIFSYSARRRSTDHRLHHHGRAEPRESCDLAARTATSLLRALASGRVRKEKVELELATDG